MYGYIYETTNLVNGKKYIGQHKYNCVRERGKYLGSGTLLRKAVEKYGKENFDVRVIEECEDAESLNKAEIYWIKYYDAVNDDNYYNILPGGSGYDIYTTYTDDELRSHYIKSSNAHFATTPRGEDASNAKLTEEDVHEIIQLLLDGEYPADIAKIYGVSDSTIIDIKAHRSWTVETEGYVFPEIKRRTDFSKRNEKPVVQYDLDGNIIETYTSIRLASEATGIHNSLISATCLGKHRSSYGYIWRFAGDPFDKYSRLDNKIWHHLEKYDKDGNYICSFNNLSDACRSLDTGTSIYAKISKMRKTLIKGSKELKECYGYLWKYQDIDSELSKIDA